MREFTWDREAFVAEIGERFAALKLVDRSSFEQSSLLRRIGAENTIRGFFVRRMRQRLEKLRELGRSPTPTATSTARSPSPSAP